MKLYLDVFTGDELFSDSYPMKIVDDVYYEVEGKVRGTTPSEKRPVRPTHFALEHHRKQRHRRFVDWWQQGPRRQRSRE